MIFFMKLPDNICYILLRKTITFGNFISDFLVILSEKNLLNEIYVIGTYLINLILIMIWCKIRGFSLSRISIVSKPDYMLAFQAVLLGAGMVQFLTVIYSFLSRGMQQGYDAEINLNLANIGLVILGYGVLVPFIEEYVFRGIIYQILRNGFSVPICIVLDSIIFGLFHSNNLQKIYTFFLGILFCMMYEISHSIMYSVLAHMIFNLAGSRMVLPDLPEYLMYVSAVIFCLVVLMLIWKFILSYQKEGDRFGRE